MKNAHGAPENRWPVIIASAILFVIVIAGARKWSHKEATTDAFGAVTEAADESTVPQPSLSAAVPTARTQILASPSKTSIAQGKNHGSKQGLSDSERASLPLSQFLQAEGMDVDRIQPDPASIERRLQIRADSLSDGQRLDLRERILSQDAPINEKQVAIHLLSLNVPASVPVLKSIAIAAVPVSASSEGIPPELPLRLSALQGLEAASLRDPRYRRILIEVSERAPNKTVREVAQLSAQQAAKGRSFFEDYTKVLAGEKR